MCGRFTLEKPDELKKHFHLALDGLEIQSRYNIAPGTYCPIVRLNEEHRDLANCYWGLVPSWAKDTKIKPINAKAETITTKPFFRSAFKKRRCIVPASGFYEWKGIKSRKTPYYIYPKNDPFFGFAGLWEKKDDVESFTIITTAANDFMQDIHSRMPVILNPDNYTNWLQDGNYELLKPCSNNEMKCHPVSRKVNSPKNDSRDLIYSINQDN